METAIRSSHFDWSASSLTHRGETDSGDKCVVTEFDGGVLVAVIDALGHGHAAAEAAEVAAKVLAQHADESPARLFERCHADMRGTRGAAISLASFDWRRHTMAWLGIGNVAGVLMLPQTDSDPQVASLVVRGGVVGDHLPELRPTLVPFTAGTSLIVATDGVYRDFTEVLPSALPPQRLAERILDGYARHDDDALVLAFRYSGN